MKKILFITSILASVTAQSSPIKICKQCLPAWDGDLVHRNGQITSVYAGHAGISTLGAIVHVTTGFPNGNALTIAMSLDEFNRDGGSFWGAKRHKSVKLKEQLQTRLTEQIIFYIRSGVTYDVLHTSQKGTKVDSNGNFLMDCVGFTEKIMEYLGYNPTPDHLEIGPGWPLSVREQRDSPNLVHTK